MTLVCTNQSVIKSIHITTICNSEEFIFSEGTENVQKETILFSLAYIIPLKYGEEDCKYMIKSDILKLLRIPTHQATKREATCCLRV